MSDLDFDFNPAEEEGTRFDLIPAGTYPVEITEAKVSATRNGHGQQLHLTGRIIEGSHEGRVFWDSIMFAHVNQMAVKIGRARIKDYCVALGIKERITNPETFKFKPFFATFTIRKDKDGVYPDKNVVTRVRSWSEGEKGKASPQPAAKAPKGAQPIISSKADDKTDFEDSIPF
jgi:hypothetical protein